MANTPSNPSLSQTGPRNPRVARRNVRLPRTGPYPSHSTIQALTSRVLRHEQQLHGMDIEIRETREQWRLLAMERIDQVSEDHENTVNNVEVLRNRVVETATETALLRLRLEECEQRTREAEEYARGLVQRLVLAEDNARQTSRLADTVDRLVVLMEQFNLRQD